MIRSPARPPASPVAITGASSCLSARATLMPLPPAEVRLALARWRWPSWKFGTVSVRSTAALRVTVTIMRRAPGDDGPSWSAYHRSRPPSPGRGTDRAATSGLVPSSVWPSQTSTRPSRCPRTTGSDTAVGAMTRSTSGCPVRTTRTSGFDATSGDRLAAPADRGLRVRRADGRASTCGTARRPTRAAARDRHFAARASGCRGSPRRSCSPCRANRRDLAPAGVVGVAGLDADQAGHDAEQVVPRVHRDAAALDRVACARARASARRASASQPARAPRRRARSTRGPERRARRVARSACAADRAARARAFIHATKRGTSPSRRRVGECVGRVVRALDERALRAGRAR